MSDSLSITTTAQGRHLLIRDHERTCTLAALWLRERAPDETTTDASTGQRLIEAADLPLDLVITGITQNADTLGVSFSDGHETRFSIECLLGEGDPAQEEEPGKTLWDAESLTIRDIDYQAALAEDTALLNALDALHQWGLVRITGVPLALDGMQGFIDRIGPLRYTNWGGIADVKSIEDAYDLTMTPRHLEPHTDNPYRDPIPGYICLHCLRNATEGGESTLADGFMAAHRLKEQAPDEFDCLTQVTPRFRYADSSTELVSEGPLIELNSQGHVWRVRYSNRTERVPAYRAEVLERYYAARRRFYELITSDELTKRLKLDPGEMFIIDNYRLLHGRTAFRLAGSVRHLRQGYLDRDSVFSRRHVLQRMARGGTEAVAQHGMRMEGTV